jgi:peptide chain release factor 2
MATDVHFWDNNDKAQEVLKERSRLESVTGEVESLEQILSDLRELIDLAREEKDTSVLEDVPDQIAAVHSRLEQMESGRLLSGPQDMLNAFVSFSPGAGGVDSADWAQMLLRMITRYCEKKNFRVDLVYLLENDEGGIKAATINVMGDFAYGHLKSERGIHRLVRISPFDANARRHTSFAAIDVTPEVDDTIEIEIREEDLQIDTFRAGGAGGQHVNKTDSAVRITHLPTGIIVQCQNERSQHKNRAQAMKMLKSRMYEKELERQREETRAANADKKDISWGSQIRSYVLAPYQLVKDTRTGEETGNVEAVLDGDLHRFVRAYLLATAEE